MPRSANLIQSGIGKAVKYGRKVFRWVARFTLGLFLVLVIAGIIIQLPPVQTRLTRIVMERISERTGMRMEIGGISVWLPGYVRIDELFIADDHGDTLVFAGRARAGIRPAALLGSRIELSNISLDRGVVNITRLQPDSLFNYELLLQAVLSPEKSGDLAGTGAMNEPPAGHNGSRQGMTLAIKRIRLNDIRLRYADHHAGFDMRFSLTRFSTSIPFIPSDFSGFHIGDTFLSGARLDLELTAPSVPRPPPPPSTTVLPDIDLMLQSARIRGFSAVVSGTDLPLQVEDLSLDLENLLLSKDTLSLELDHMAADFPGLFRLNRLSFLAGLGRESFRMDEWVLESDESSLEASLWLGMNVMEADLTRAGAATVDLDLRNLQLGSDLTGLFESGVVGLPEDVAKMLPSDLPPVLLSGRLHGRVADLRMERIRLDVPGALSLAMHGALRGLPDAAAMEADIPELSLVAGRSLYTWPVAGAFLPPGFNPPDTMEILATLQGGPAGLSAAATLNSVMGRISASGFYREEEGAAPAYSLNATADRLEVGQMLGMPDLLGHVTASMHLAGVGLTQETADAVFNLTLSEAAVNTYTYRDVQLEGWFRDQVMHADIQSRDEHLAFTSSNTVVTGPGIPALSASWTVRHMDTHALHLTTDTLVLSTSLNADIRLTHPDFFDGMIRLDQTRLSAHGLVFSLDSLYIAASSGNGDDEPLFALDIQSGIFLARYEGNISPVEIPAVMTAHLNQHMDLAGLQDTGMEEAHPPEAEIHPTRTGQFPIQTGQQGDMPEVFPVFSADLRVLPSSWFTEVFFPALQSFEALTVRSAFDGQTGVFSLDGHLASLVYDGMAFSGMELSSGTTPETMDFHLGVARFEGVGLQVSDLLLQGRFSDDALQFDLGFDDTAQNRWLQIGGKTTASEGVLLTSFDRELILNRDRWTIGEGNLISYGNGRLLFSQLEIGREGSSLSVQSRVQPDEDIPPSHVQPDEETPPVDLVFHQFHIENLFPSDGVPMAAGVIDGNLTLFEVLGSPSFDASLSITQFAFQGDPLGDIRLHAQSEGLSMFRFSASVEGHGNQIALDGYYHDADEPDFSVNLELTSLDLATLEAFTFGELSELQGISTGSLRIWGSPAAPGFSGSLRFEETAFRVAFSNVRYHLDGQEIRFDRNAIGFQQFTMTDEAGHSARLNGNLNMSDFPDLSFNLDLNSSRFLLMNVPEGQNPIYSGRLVVGSNLRLRGSLGAPVVDGRFALLEGSSFQLLVPQTDPQAVGAEGVVAFIAPGDSLVWPPAEIQQAHDPLMSALRNLEVSVNVEVDPGTDLRVVIDEFAGDYLQVRGGGLLSYGTDPGGRISLAGRYELTEGTYLLTFYDIIRRQFSIRRGSSILWTGDPMTPVVDITAVFHIRTSVRELFEHQPGGADDPRLRQQFPFQVLLKMQGNMLQPDIDFEIVLPPEHQQALDGRLQTRLNALNQDESERNKQVFALLMLESFIQDNPFASVGDGPGLEAAARTSASRILSQQLNRLSGQYIRGVDIQFDVQSHEDFLGDGTGGSTQLNVEVSRNFLDERMRVTVGGNIELEDDRRREASAGDIAGDFAIEYLLNPDGSLVIKGFRKKDFGDLFEGQIIETGLALMFVRTYNHLRELFMKREEDLPDP